MLSHYSTADGIALGAAASTDNTELELVIFVAIMLHKVVPLGNHSYNDYIMIMAMSLLAIKNCYV